MKALKGNIIFTASRQKFEVYENSYLGFHTVFFPKNNENPWIQGFSIVSNLLFSYGGGEPYTIVATISREDLLENYR